MSRSYSNGGSSNGHPSHQPSYYAAPASQPLRMLQVELRDPCAQCHGTGRIGVSQPYCLLCGRTWTQADFNRAVERQVKGSWWWGWWRSRRLTCGHAASYLRYTNPSCPHCGGMGGQRRWVPLAWLAQQVGRLIDERRAG